VETSRWFQRIEKKREQEGRNVRWVTDRTGLTHTSYYDYKNNPNSYPRDPSIIKRIAAYLDEDPFALETEMRHGALAVHRSVLDAIGSTERNILLYQEHVRALAHVLGLTTGVGQEFGRVSDQPLMDGTRAANAPVPRWSGVDIVARLLRERMPRPADPLDVCVVVRPTPRGVRAGHGSSVFRADGWEPYQYQIYVVPERVASGAATLGDTARLLDITRSRVDEALSGVLLPVTREHSTELFLDMFAGRADLLLYPGLLEMRPPALQGGRSGATRDVLVAGVYYAGAPDVAALLARRLGYGFATFDQLAKLQISAGLRGLPNNRLGVVTRGVALDVFTNGRPEGGRMMWAVDDPDTLLDEHVRDALEDFPGRPVMLQLSDDALTYAAYRVCCVDSTCPDQRAQDQWRDRLRHQQDELRHVLGGRALVHDIDLPPQARRRADGTYPDAVHEMFDRYVDAAHRVHAGLTDV
jgi:hypothetical protein